LLQLAHIELTSELPATPVIVLADPVYLLRMLTIVLENAGKYTFAGGSVRLILQETEGRARIGVRDTGIGIPLQDRARIFERFCRGSNVQQADAHGSGLGLSLATWIAERHKTTIEVESAEGVGSSFSWTLPLNGPGSKEGMAKDLIAADNSCLSTMSTDSSSR
jgi:signal transduction histidine kinase